MLPVGPDFVGFLYTGPAQCARRHPPSMAGGGSRGIHAARPTPRNLRSACTQVAFCGVWTIALEDRRQLQLQLQLQLLLVHCNCDAGSSVSRCSVGAGLLAKASGQPLLSKQTHRVRQQAGSYRSLHSSSETSAGSSGMCARTICVHSRPKPVPRNHCEHCGSSVSRGSVGAGCWRKHLFSRWFHHSPTAFASTPAPA
jgi:hypothetical protein